MKTREEQIEEMARAICATGVALDGTDYAFGVYSDDDHFHKMASALYDANIGDVTEWKESAEKHRVIALPGGRIKQLYSDEEVEQIAKERDALKERADSEIKSCYKEIAEKRDEIAKLRKQLKLAQNAAKKQKHRAEVAEKALKLVSECDEISDAFCEARGGEDCDFRCNTCLYNYFLQQAEREIEEEKGE